MNPYFSALGQSVLERWTAQNFSLSHFPDLAFDALEENPPASHVDVEELIREFLLNEQLPFQSQSGFGQPELIAYDHPRFYIQILFWLEGTTDIHQHMFSGAFHVLKGSSIHSQFSFENRQPVSAHLHIGNLKLLSTELLETGRTERIVSGTSYIHSLFHLDTPSITVVLRTHTDPGSSPQFTYLPPHIAVDPLLNDTLTQRRKELLDVLEQTQDPSYAPLVIEMIQQLDFERGFFILQNGMRPLTNLGVWEETLDIFREKHGSLADGVSETLEGIVRRDNLVAFRKQVEDVEHRYFLALLLNVPDCHTLLNLAAEKISGDPVETVMRWAEELCDSSEFGTSILDAEFPEEFDVTPEEQPEAMLSALRYFLERGRDSALSISLRAMPAICAGDLNGWRSVFSRSGLRTLVP